MWQKEWSTRGRQGQFEEKFDDTEGLGIIAEEVSLNIWEGTEVGAHGPQSLSQKQGQSAHSERRKNECGDRCLRWSLRCWERMAVLSDCLHTLSETERSPEWSKGGGAEGRSPQGKTAQKHLEEQVGKALRNALSLPTSAEGRREAQMVRNLTWVQSARRGGFAPACATLWVWTWGRQRVEFNKHGDLLSEWGKLRRPRELGGSAKKNCS